MGIATRVLTNAGRAADALPAWRHAAAAFPGDEELQEGLFQSAAGSLEYGALQAAAVRLMKLKNGSAEASVGEKLSASWAAATATALASMHARDDNGSGPLGKAGLGKLARAMVYKLDREKKGGALTPQQLCLARAVRRRSGEGGDEKVASGSSPSPASAAAERDPEGEEGREEEDSDAVSIPDAFSELKRALSKACREALKASGKLDAVAQASRAFFDLRGGTPGAAASAARVVSRAVRRSSSPPPAAVVSVAKAAVAGARASAESAGTAAAAVSTEDFSAALLGFQNDGDGDGDGDSYERREEKASRRRRGLLSIVPLDTLPGEGEGEQEVDIEAAIGAALLAVEAHVVAGRRKHKLASSSRQRGNQASSSSSPSSSSFSSSASDHFAAAFLLAEACCLLDPLDPRARLAAASVAGVLGDAATARAHGDALSLKHILADTLASHLLLPALLAAGDSRGAAGLCGRIAALHSGARAEVGGALKAALTNRAGGESNGDDDGQTSCSGNFGVALSLAEFASTLSKSHERRVAAVSAATARVEAAAVVGSAGASSSSSSSSSSPSVAVAAVAAAAAQAVADLASFDALAEDSSSSSRVVFTDDFSPRPRWLPPPRGDVRLAVRRWWEDDDDDDDDDTENDDGEGEEEESRSQKLDHPLLRLPPWWTEHGSASSESTPQAASWRLAASAALRERARLPERVLAALEPPRSGRAEGAERTGPGGPSPAPSGPRSRPRPSRRRRRLSDLPGDAERALWAAADAIAAVAAADGGGGATGEEKGGGGDEGQQGATASALASLSAAAEVFSSCAETIARAIDKEEGEEEEEGASRVLSLGGPSTSGVALALSHAAALAAVICASWQGRSKNNSRVPPDALLPGISALASSSRKLTATLSSSLTPPRASAPAIEERLSRSEEFSHVLRWVRRQRGGQGSGGGGDDEGGLDVHAALSRLVAGQAASASAAASAARGAAEVR